MDARYYHIQHFHEKNSVYTCCVYKRDLTSITTISGEHSVNFTNDDVRGVALVNCKLSSFPRELSNIFPKLDHLAINGGLCEISKEDLACFPNLKFLDLQGCDIKVLPIDLFESSPNIELIYFSYNKISSIGNNLLEPLRALKYIDFRGNSILNVVYDEDKANELTLKELKMMIRTQSGFVDNFVTKTHGIRT